MGVLKLLDTDLTKSEREKEVFGSRADEYIYEGNTAEGHPGRLGNHTWPFWMILSSENRRFIIDSASGYPMFEETGTPALGVISDEPEGVLGSTGDDGRNHLGAKNFSDPRSISLIV